MMQTHVLYTGGTLGMVSTPNGLAPGADLTGWLNQLLSGTELAGTFETLSFEHLIDSANATPDDWRRIVDDLWEHRDDADSFVVLHGTDTLAYTSAALSYALTEFGKPVVVTGAQYSLGVVGTDAAPNVTGALRAATSGRLNGVAVGNRHQDAQRAAGDIHPEVPDGVLTTANESANQRNRDRDAGSGGDEILHTQASELDEVPEGRLR